MPTTTAATTTMRDGAGGSVSPALRRFLLGLQAGLAAGLLALPLVGGHGRSG